MGDLNRDLKASQSVSIIDEETGLKAQVKLIDGDVRLVTGGIQTIDSLRGFDNIADTWFYLGTEVDANGAGNIGDTIRVQIAAGSNPILFPAVDLTYTLVAQDVGDEEQLALNIASFLNAQSSFNTLWRAQKITGSGCVYITSKRAGSQYERPNIDDFLVTSTGTTVVTRAFQNIIRQNKGTSLARDPADPRVGIIGIQGSVTQTEGDVTTKFQTVFPNLLVDGSITPVDFTVSADPVEVKFISKIIFGGRGNGIKFGQFLSRTTLTNGLQISFKSNDFMGVREAIRTTEDFADLHAGDPSKFAVYVQAGGDKFIAVLEFGSPLEIRPQGEFATNDYVKVSVRDNLTSGVTQLKAIIEGFNREY